MGIDAHLLQQQIQLQREQQQQREYADQQRRQAELTRELRAPMVGFVQKMRMAGLEVGLRLHAGYNQDATLIFPIPTDRRRFCASARLMTEARDAAYKSGRAKLVTAAVLPAPMTRFVEEMKVAGLEAGLSFNTKEGETAAVLTFATSRDRRRFRRRVGLKRKAEDAAYLSFAGLAVATAPK